MYVSHYIIRNHILQSLEKIMFINEAWELSERMHYVFPEEHTHNNKVNFDIKKKLLLMNIFS